MKALSPEQLLIIGDAFCDKHNVQVASFSALAAAAAVPGARFNGIALYTSPSAASSALAETLRRLTPLSSLNDEFAVVASEVYLRWANA